MDRSDGSPLTKEILSLQLIIKEADRSIILLLFKIILSHISV